MSISLFASNDIGKLSSFISKHIHGQYTQADPFLPIHIVTQTEGMNVWLKTKLAEHLGISANIQFHSPQEIIQIIYEKTGGIKHDHFSRESIQWILFKEMNDPEFLNNPSFKTIKDYCCNDDRKRLGLAGELSDLFDQYTIYRYDLIEKWNKNIQPTDDFQEYLWRQLKIKLNEHFNDKTVVRNQILEKLKKINEEELKSNFSDIRNLYFFGLSIFTPYHMEIFKGLSQYLDLNFYFLNPCPSIYWYEDKPEKSIRWLEKMNIPHAKTIGNNLLTNWGKIIQESFYLFLDCEEAVNSYHDEIVPITNQGKLLGKLQQQIIQNDVTITDKFSLDEVMDGSLNIHSSYTKAREVESLYNYILSLIEKDSSITGKDIIVSCNIDEYAPYIHAVFDTAPYPLKYTIADSAYVQGDNPMQALKHFLQLTEENFNAEEVFQLLEFSSIKKKIGIENIELIKIIIKKSLFRFGIYGTKNDDSFLFSLKHAIQKIVHGVAIRTDNTFNGFYPLDILEGLDSMEGMRFCLFADKLINLIAKREAVLKISEWAQYIEEVMTELIFQEEENDETILRYQNMIIQHLSKYHCLDDHLNEPIPYQLFASDFISLISKDKREKRFISHGITFCSYIPMRSLPFKLVCMLGMDFDKFPRKDSKLSFSHIDGQFRAGSTVIKSKRRRGDRSIRDNDKHLFLENMMSAREYLYLSYIGNSAKNNATNPPSVFVDELINYIAENSNQPEEIRNKIIVRHPLHSFSKKYNHENPRLINYLINRKTTLEIQSQKNDPVSVQQPIDIETLIRFFKNPIEYYYKNILGIFFEKENTVLPVTESFTMDYLDEWKIKNLYLSDQSNIDFRDLIIQGEIPPANMGKAESEMVIEDLKQLRSSILIQKQDLEQKSLELDIQLHSNVKVTGRVNNIFGNKLIDYALSSNKKKYTLPHVIKYICLRAAGYDITPVFLDPEGNLIAHTSIDQNTALKYLNTLVEMFIQGHQSVLPLYIEFKIPHTKLFKAKTEDELKEFALIRYKIIEDSIFNPKGGPEFNDEYVLNLIKNKFFEDDNNIIELFKNTKTIFELIISIYPNNML